MTIVIGPSRATQVTGSNQENNPVILWADAITGATAPDGVATNGEAANALSGNTFDVAMPLVVSNVAILAFTASAAINNISIAAHNLGTLGASVTVQYFESGAWVDTEAGTVNPTDDQAIMWRIGGQNRADWRVRMTGIASGQPMIGVLMAGIETIVNQRIYIGYAPPLTPNRIDIQPVMSEGGHFLGSVVVSKSSQVVAEITEADIAFVRSTDWLGFQAHFNSGAGFFWGWRPEKYGDLFYARSNGGVLAPQNTGPKDRVSFSLPMEFYHDY